jgi:hypothetical protein
MVTPGMITASLVYPGTITCWSYMTGGTVVAGITLSGIVVPGTVLVRTVYASELLSKLMPGWTTGRLEVVTCTGSEGVIVLGLEDGPIASYMLPAEPSTRV